MMRNPRPLVGCRGDVQRHSGKRGVWLVAQSTDHSQPNKKAVVVGAGPVGLASAAMLASRGWKVDVLERRADPTTNERGETVRTYPMAVSQKGRRCLQSASVDISDYLSRRPSTFLSRGSSLVDWHSLNCAILSQVRGSHPKSITFHWSCDLEFPDSIDLGKRHLALRKDPDGLAASGRGIGPKNRSSDRTLLAYDLLVGADGADSFVRRALEDAGCLQSKVVLDARTNGKTYKAFHGLDPRLDSEYAAMPGTDMSQGMKRKSYGKNKELLLNFWVGSSDSKDRKMSVMAVATEDTFEESAFAHLVEEEASELPLEWQKAMVSQNTETRPNRFGRIIWNSGYAGPSTVLVGDAAHAVTSSLGNGCNLGLGSVQALAAALDEAKQQREHHGEGKVCLQGALESYSKAWTTEAHAFQRLERVMALSLRSGALGAVIKILHLCSAAGGLILRAVAPNRFPSALFPFWIYAPQLSYAVIQRSYVGTVALGSGLFAAAVSLLWFLSTSALQAVLGA